jgi:hypothetical protein
METKIMRTIQPCTVRDAPALHGADIGTIFAGQAMVVEISAASPHDGWLHLVGPNPPINADGTYLKTKKPAWVEAAHLVEIVEDKTIVQVEIDWVKKTWLVK